VTAQQRGIGGRFVDGEDDDAGTVGGEERRERRLVEPRVAAPFEEAGQLRVDVGRGILRDLLGQIHTPPHLGGARAEGVDRAVRRAGNHQIAVDHGRRVNIARPGPEGPELFAGDTVERVDAAGAVAGNDYVARDGRR